MMFQLEDMKETTIWDQLLVNRDRMGQNDSLLKKLESRGKEANIYHHLS